MSEPVRHQFELQVEPTGHGSSVVIDGKDLSAAVRGFNLSVSLEGASLDVDMLGPSKVRGVIGDVHLMSEMTVIVLDGEPIAVCETTVEAAEYFRSHPDNSERYETFVVPCFLQVPKK